jgi:hypothetical protein
MILLMRASTSPAADCPIAAPSRETTYVRALHRACLILGGLAQLADHLRVADAQLQTWLQGREEPPESVFFAAVEILLLYAEDVRGAG